MSAVNTKSHHNIFNTLKLYCVLVHDTIPLGFRFGLLQTEAHVKVIFLSIRMVFALHRYRTIISKAHVDEFPYRFEFFFHLFWLVAGVSCLDAAKHEEAYAICGEFTDYNFPRIGK